MVSEHRGSASPSKQPTKPVRIDVAASRARANCCLSRLSRGRNTSARPQTGRLGALPRASWLAIIEISRPRTRTARVRVDVCIYCYALSASLCLLRPIHYHHTILAL
jgi:hypothetical protein